MSKRDHDKRIAELLEDVALELKAAIPRRSSQGSSCLSCRREYRFCSEECLDKAYREQRERSVKVGVAGIVGDLTTLWKQLVVEIALE